MVSEYCLKCHSTKRQKGDLDLEVFSSLAQVKKHPKIWQAVWEQLGDGEMPPKDKPQPSAEQKLGLMKSVRSMLDAIAMERAGDPGQVVIRRLSNAEYTYTLRDLTGIDSLVPAKEFPVDGAAGEGFTNTGQALVMSPTLVTKYLDAGKSVASHMVLLPDGIRFSSKITRRDWTNETLAEIRDFYARFSSAEGGDKVNLQGIAFSTNEGGRLPLEKYLEAAIVLRDGGKDLKQLAQERNLSAKYLGLLVTLLNGSEPSPLLNHLRNVWRTAKPGDSVAMAAEVAQWQRMLWKFGSVGHIGKAGGPKAWMEPITPLVAQQEFKLKLAAPANGNEIAVYLAAGDAGDGSVGDTVVWQQPRVLIPGRPALLLRDVRDFVREMKGRKVGPQVGREKAPEAKIGEPEWGLDPRMFGKHPNGEAMEPVNLCVQAPSVVEIRLPADLFAGAELVTTGALDQKTGIDGSVQLQVLTVKPDPKSGLILGAVSVERGNVPWTSDNRIVLNSMPIIANAGSAAYKRLQLAFDEFRRVFPPALCYTKIVPVDEVVTLTLLYREDDHLAELVLDDAQKAKLDRLWDELRFVSQDALTLVDAFEQIWQFATQDADPKVFEPMRKPIADRAAAFRQKLIDCEPKHVEAVVEFASRAYRRPLTASETNGLRVLYRKFREQEQSHEDAIRLLLARVLVSPGFLYRAETPGAGVAQVPVSDWELATRLSYFLWSSEPDAELRAVAASGKLREPEVLAAQTRRMMGDARVRRLATEFACQWIHIYDFDTLDEKSERHFPTFGGLRDAMYEESIQFFTDFFQHNRSVLGVLDADFTFLNQSLANHYGIPGVTGPQWRRVEGIKKYSRGGILGQATTLAKQSGASRTSPILRGNWVAEVLLGDKLPKPPKDVPRLPEDESTEGLTMRQLTEKHTSDPRCAGCHKRIDSFGFALEGFDAIGRRREKDLGNRPIDTRSKAMDGTELVDIDGLRGYLLTKRRDAYLRQFCKKLLGYSLGRAVQLSDEPLLKDIRTKLAAGDYRVQIAIDMIVQSRQFREIRGRDVALDE